MPCTRSLRIANTPKPSATPTAVPVTPITKACAQKHSATSRARAPSAPSNPISRVFRTTEISSELITENAAMITMNSSRKKLMLFSRFSTHRKSAQLSIHENARVVPGGSVALSCATTPCSSAPGFTRT